MEEEWKKQICDRREVELERKMRSELRGLCLSYFLLIDLSFSLSFSPYTSLLIFSIRKQFWMKRKREIEGTFWMRRETRKCPNFWMVYLLSSSYNSLHLSYPSHFLSTLSHFSFSLDKFPSLILGKEEIHEEDPSTSFGHGDELASHYRSSSLHRVN